MQLRFKFPIKIPTQDLERTTLHQLRQNLPQPQMFLMHHIY